MKLKIVQNMCINQIYVLPNHLDKVLYLGYGRLG